MKSLAYPGERPVTTDNILPPHQKVNNEVSRNFEVRVLNNFRHVGETNI